MCTRRIDCYLNFGIQIRATMKTDNNSITKFMICGCVTTSIP